MNADAPRNRALAAWQRLSALPLGKSLFTRIVQWQAPYFRTIPARFETLEPGFARLSLVDRRRVHNHLGTVHAIALCNAAELAAGTLSEATTPATHRWIPKGMSVEYLAKARGRLSVEARLELPQPLAQALAVPVQVSIRDAGGTEVFRARIEMWISPKRDSAPHSRASTPG
jgi:acyl-coenzyme A thioesterase PaaI-like protein